MNSNLDSFLEGYRFVPLEGELLFHYLRKNLRNERLPPSRIMEVNQYQYSAEELEGKKYFITLNIQQDLASFIVYVYFKLKIY